MQAPSSIRRLTLIALALAGPPVLAFTPVGPPPDAGADRGIAILQCVADDSPPLRRTRGAIMDVGVAEPFRDAVLTTAHGLPSTIDAVLRDCLVFAGGRPHRIQAAWLGEASDWAVVVTKRPLRGQIARLKPLTLTPDTVAALAGADSAVRLLRLTLHQDCRIERGWLAPTDIARGLFMHSCQGWPGLSGSPVIASMAGERVVIGIHIGRVWRPPHGDGPPLLGLGRTIDEAVTTALAEAAALAARRRE